MDFQKYLNKPTHELELFMDVSEDIRLTRAKRKEVGNFILDLQKTGSGKEAFVANILEFSDPEKLLDFQYYKRHGLAHMAIAPRDGFVCFLFTGHFFCFSGDIDNRGTFVSGGYMNESFPSKFYEPILTREEMAAAFGDLSSELTSRKKPAV